MTGDAGLHVLGGRSCYGLGMRIRRFVAERGSGGLNTGTGDDTITRTEPRTPDPNRTPIPGIDYPPADDACSKLGTWGLARPGGAPVGSRAWLYQMQVTGVPPTFGFYMNGSSVEFDGCRNGMLQEAKGCGYATNIDEPWYSGRGDLVKQARNQAFTAQKAGVPLMWFVAEESMVSKFGQLFQQNGIFGINVLFQPAVPPCP